MKKKSKLPNVKGIWTVDDKLGGWAATQKHFFDEKVCWCKLLSLLHKGQTGLMLPSCTWLCMECCCSSAAVFAEFGIGYSPSNDTHYLSSAAACRVYCMIPHRAFVVHCNTVQV